jgi:hypothetical protein
VKGLTSSIALLVGTALDPLLPLLALGIDAFFAHAVLDAAEARSGIVTFLTCLLTVSTGILDLTTLRTGHGGSDERRGRSEWIHVKRDGEVHRGRHGGRRALQRLHVYKKTLFNCHQTNTPQHCSRRLVLSHLSFPSVHVCARGRLCSFPASRRHHLRRPRCRRPSPRRCPGGPFFLSIRLFTVPLTRLFCGYRPLLTPQQ